MDISLFDYQLPPNLIADSPVEPRDHSKLLIVNREIKKINHDHFYNITSYLTKNDVLVFNNSKVFPARLFGKKETGGKIELLLLRNIEGTTWNAMHKGKLKPCDKLIFDGVDAQVLSAEGGIAQINFKTDQKNLMKIIYNIGHTPIPPYIKTGTEETELRIKYQTIYAKTEGSAAAPTAGFHFTQNLMEKLKNKGVQMEYVTLHVGLGTFAPVKELKLENHKIHSEYFEVDKDTIERLNNAKKSGKRIIAVGTTATRVLETLADNNSLLTTNYKLPTTNLFIYPPYKFKFVDGLITNFHLPKSTLLTLVSAFVSYPNSEEKFISFTKSLIGKAYNEAINKNYRFYSFGDASLIL